MLTLENLVTVCEKENLDPRQLQIRIIGPDDTELVADWFIIHKTFTPAGLEPKGSITIC